jgi:RimJ/RimL family protein N-acetyltransferase
MLDIGANFRAMEVVEGDRILAMFGFDEWRANSVCLHVAVDDSLSGRRAGWLLLPHAFRFIFERQGLGVALATILSTNTASMKAARHIGFREVYRGRDWYAKGVDTVWMEMRQDECRWLTGVRKAA